MHRLARLLIAALLIGAAVPGTTHGAYPGEDGRIAAITQEHRIQIMDADGGNVDLGPFVTSPRWSPGGTMLTFLSGSSIYAVDPDATNLRKLISLPNPFVYDFDWSPDGSQLVYTAFDPAGVGGRELFIISVDGGEPRRLTYRPQDDSWPAWSPDGQWIAYVRQVFHYGEDFHVTYEIWAIRTDRSEVHQLSSGQRDGSPEWAPDGSHVAFHGQSATGTGVYAVDPDGTDLIRLAGTDGVSGPSLPAYSPSGERLVFTAAGLGAELVIATAGGTPLDVIGSGYQADWQPLPEFPLVDARFSPYNLNIVWAYAGGVTFGCTTERYCPNAVVTRGQLAAFLARQLDLPPTEEDFFTDDEDDPFEGAINRVAAAELVTGCAVDQYCPSHPVTREQVATFLANALGLPAPVGDHFTDDEASIHEVDINRLADAGVARGCTVTTYCPTQVLTRGQMAALLNRSFD